jgi:hypothetical protein
VLSITRKGLAELE